MSQKQDSAFMVSFAGVLGILVAITLGIMVLAGFMSSRDGKPDAETVKKIAERTAPVGTVITDPAALVKTASAAKREPLGAEQLYASVCSACHTGGLLGAPKVGDKAAWSARKAANGGVDGLVASAIKGKNSMPARGGNADLTDDEIKATVELMLKKSGV